MRLSWRVGVWACGLFLVAGLAGVALAQADYPFRNPKLADDARIDDLLHRLTLEEKLHLLADFPKYPELGVAFTGQVEGLHGLALGGPGGWGGRDKPPQPTTTFPQEKGLGMTWDPELLKKIASLEGYEARYISQNPAYNRGGLIIRAPNADLSRDPRWGRTEESYGEDPYLVGTLTAAFAQGLQGPDPKHWQAASLMKHFLANENENGRSNSSSEFGERLFREYYSVPFRMGFEQGGSRAVMAAYNAWNGTPMLINPVLKNVMIREWGNDGLICSDGGALGMLVFAHKSFADKEHAVAAAVKVGVNNFLDRYIDDLRKAIQDGLLTEAELDASLHNEMRVFLRLGEMDPAGADPYGKIGREADGAPPPWERPASKALARLATDESIVLLKNEGNTLPLNRAKLKSIAVIGPWADQVLLDWYSGTPPYTVSALQGIREGAGSGVNVVYADGSDPAKAAALAREADVAIVVVGNHPECNAGWDRVPHSLQRQGIRGPQDHRAGTGRAGEADFCGKSTDHRSAARQLPLRHRLEPAESSGDCAYDAQQPGGGPRTGRCALRGLFAGRAAEPDLAHGRRPATAYDGLRPDARAHLSLQHAETAVRLRLRAQLHELCVRGDKTEREQGDG